MTLSIRKRFLYLFHPIVFPATINEIYSEHNYLRFNNKQRNCAIWLHVDTRFGIIVYVQNGCTTQSIYCTYKNRLRRIQLNITGDQRFHWFYTQIVYIRKITFLLFEDCRLQKRYVVTLNTIFDTSPCFHFLYNMEIIERN